MTFDWTTLALQAINFLVLVWLLHRLLYRPVLAAIDRRRASEARALGDAAAAQRAAEAEQAHWQTERETLDADRRALRQQAEHDATERAQAILNDARTEAERLIAQGRDTLTAERDALAAEVRHEASQVARRLAERLLREIAPDVGPEPFLERLDHQLSTLSPEDLDTQGPITSARLLVAPALSLAARATWQRRLSDRLGGVPVEVTAAPDLIAGARLCLPGTIFETGWAEALTTAERRMAEDERAS